VEGYWLAAIALSVAVFSGGFIPRWL